MANGILSGQLIKLQAEFNRLKRDADPRTEGPGGKKYSDDRDGRVQWARDHIGWQKLESFSDLTQLQAEYLLDTLVKGHNKTKLDAQIDREMTRLGIYDRGAYFHKVIQGDLRWKFGGHSYSFLNRYQKYQLCKMLSSRSPSQTNRPAPWERSKAPVTVSNEQQTLWGMR